MPKPKTIGSDEIQAAIKRLATAISERHPSTRRLLLLGIANGGVELARRLAQLLHARAGVLDVSFHRDDIGSNPIPKEFAPTHIPTDVNGASVILVDDVLFSGRTTKAALDELFDHGRPTKVELTVLVDRGRRLLPVAADYAGFTLALGADEDVVVTLDPKNPALDSIRIKTASPGAHPSPL
ncbi:MAG TPA: bifunctional pyr operon transcriptional regulator/uracil phosphoribosyltransferase PyrR [Opitutaceae bacterium]|nr:bifunctional pyr operon transcriptional regulator/uracil phosphoribosyltransferase PyrR [Opitutaceae bacterium]